MLSGCKTPTTNQPTYVHKLHKCTSIVLSGSYTRSYRQSEIGSLIRLHRLTNFWVKEAHFFMDFKTVWVQCHTRQIYRMCWASASHFGKMSDLNIYVWSLVESNQWLNKLILVAIYLAWHLALLGQNKEQWNEEDNASAIQMSLSTSLCHNLIMAMACYQSLFEDCNATGG